MYKRALHRFYTLRSANENRCIMSFVALEEFCQHGEESYLMLGFETLIFLIKLDGF